MNHESDSSSDSSFGGMGSNAIPKTALKWTKQNLERISVFYEDSAKPVSDILALMRTKVVAAEKYRSMPDILTIPEISRKVKDFTKTVLTFTLDLFQMDTPNLKRNIDKARTEFASRVKDFEREHHDLLQGNERLFQCWEVNILHFFTSLTMFIRKWETWDVSELTFKQLFMDFSKIFLLHPEIGDLPGQLNIGGTAVTGLSDVRFVDPAGTIICVSEVKQFDAFKGNFTEKTFNINNHISHTVLGQHGVKLVLDGKNSIFKPNIAGIICIGTKLILTYLNITPKHYHLLHTQGRIDSRYDKADILYTKPLDFLDAADCEELFEVLFWIGYVQSDAYKMFL